VRSAMMEMDRLAPFVFPLPDEAEGHIELLDRTKSVVMRSGFVSLQSGESVGVHSTGRCEELILVLRGRGEVEAEGFGRMEVRASCAVYIPPYTSHDVINTGTEPLRYVYVVAPVLSVADKPGK